MPTVGDPYVYNVQQWVNNTYRNRDGYTEITENGQTGWDTIYALLHGLQITLNVGSTANNFGTGTENAFNNYVAINGPIQQQTSQTSDQTRKEINGIIQGALICKGYDIGVSSPTEQFLGGTGTAITNLKSDAGLSDATTIVTLNIMKALLSMDYFYSYDTSERTQKIIAMQRYLNGNYEDYIGIRPCDGVYGRRTSTGLILAIQAEEQMPVSVANGNCGPSTKRCLPPIPYSGGYPKNGQTYGLSYLGNTYTNTQINKFKKLANIALYFNGFGSGNITTTIDSNVVSEFQTRYAIPETGNIDYTTWLSMLISCGDTDRSAIACDCATIITTNNINVLTSNGYNYIGRYLSGYIASGVSKALSKNELQLLFSNGIRLFPIHQRSANSITYFTSSNAIADAESAWQYASDLKLQFGAIIYFAVDFDATDYQITNNILPYFSVLYNKFLTLNKGRFRVGVYGTRNLCKRVCDAGYACSSFVGDMSTGFSGNLGFALPDNWALDQFNTVTISSGGNSIEIDKDGFSGNYLGISQEYSTAEDSYDNLTDIANSFILANRSGVNIPVYAAKEHYNWPLPTTGTQYVVSGSQIGVIQPNAFFIFYGVTNPWYDTVHKVLFYDGNDVKMGYIDGEHEYPAISATDMNQANYDQRPLYCEPYSCLRYDPVTDTYTLDQTTSDKLITINKPVPYFNVSGDYVGTLHAGDVVHISYGNINNTGNSRPWCYRVNMITKSDGTVLNSNYYVSTGIEYGSLGTNRAWY